MSNDIERELLRDLLSDLLKDGDFPELMPFRQRHKRHRRVLDTLEEKGLVRQHGARYVLTTEGLLACDSDESRQLIHVRNEVLPALLDLYRQNPHGIWPVGFIANTIGVSLQDTRRALRFLSYEVSDAIETIMAHWGDDFTEHVRLTRWVKQLHKLEARHEIGPEPQATPTEPVPHEPLRLHAVEVSGSPTSPSCARRTAAPSSYARRRARRCGVKWPRSAAKRWRASSCRRSSRCCREGAGLCRGAVGSASPAGAPQAHHRHGARPGSRHQLFVAGWQGANLE